MGKRITGSELIEKIQSREIKSGAVINCIHTGSIKYEHKVYFNGNWFSKTPYSYEKSTPRYDDIILHLCNPDVVYEIIDKEVKPITKEDIEALGYACREMKKCFERGWNKSSENKPLIDKKEDEDDKDIPPIPDDELYKIDDYELLFGKTRKEKIDYNFKVLQEKINQIAEEFNQFRKEMDDAR